MNFHLRIRETLEQYLAETRAPGISVGIHSNGALILATGVGCADIARNCRVNSSTMFRIGSISKSLTSAAVGVLFEKGKLDLDAPIQKYVPSFPEKQYPITTRQLAGHLSGLPDYQENDFENLIHYESVVAALEKFKDRELLFKPGDRYCYSSFGYNLLGAIVEGAATIPFLEFMNIHVFEPLGMKATKADHVEATDPHRTSFYDIVNDQIAIAPFTDNSDVWPAGGFLSTPTDLVAFGSALIEGKLLRHDTVNLLFEPMRTADGQETGYGFGWQTCELYGRRVMRHDGAHFGASASLAIFPEDRIVIAMTANLYNEKLFEIVEKLARLLFYENN